MVLQTSDDKIRYKHCRDCIFFDLFEDGHATVPLCQREPLTHNREYRDLSADVAAYSSSAVPCPYKVSIDRVVDIIKERMHVD